MNFEKKEFKYRLGEGIGYVIAYLIFTAAIYYFLKFFGKFPSGWNFLYIMNISLLITLLGIFFRRALR
jgi:hypothetical protein